MNSQLKEQYTVTEENVTEGETFKYIISVTKSQYAVLKEKCESLGNGTLDISKSAYLQSDVQRMNRIHKNSFMDYIGFYKFKRKAIDDWKEFGDCFCKGSGLTRKLKG